MVGHNRVVRRGLLLAGLWALGVGVAVALAFAAVGQVAHGVAPRDVARLSQRAIDDALTSPTTRSPRTSTPSRTTAASTPTTRTSSTSGPTVTTSRTQPPTTTTTTAPPTTVSTAATTPSTVAHNTVTASEGGTLFTRCSGANTIQYVSAVPRSGYERIEDVETAAVVRQSFENGSHRSKIEAECSDGVVHAQVEEESADD